MATVRMKENPQLNDQMLRTEKLIFVCALTPVASLPVISSDIPSVSLQRTQGNTATVDAIEVLPWTTPNNTSSVFGLYLAIGKTVTPSLGPVPTMEDYADAVYTVSVSDKSNPSQTLVVTGPGGTTGVNAFLTPLGNIAIEVSASGLNLTTTAVSLVVDVNYREEVK
jgi:hypothetical protein